MDSLTQIVLGAAVGEAVLGKKVGNRAMFYGAIAGTIPDLDVLSSFFVDTVTALEIHRGFTHSLLFCLIFAPIFGYLVSRIDSYKSVKGWSMLFFWGLFTHPILDAHTSINAYTPAHAAKIFSSSFCNHFSQNATASFF